ncbi:MAG: hypothetical protein ACETVR_04435 [Candidatus Bathyarchaeia archaeon]
MNLNGPSGVFPYDYYPKIYQKLSEENLCVPICIKIVLETMRHRVQRIPRLTIEKIAKKIGTEADATPLGYNIENINEELITTIPSIEFKIGWLIPKWKIICDDINLEEKLVIMAINQYDSLNNKYMKHTVVLLKANDERVVYFDPIYGEINELTSSFYSKWEPLDRFCIRLKIGERAQRVLEEFPNISPKGVENL